MFLYSVKNHKLKEGESMYIFLYFPLAHKLVSLSILSVCLSVSISHSLIRKLEPLYIFSILLYVHYSYFLLILSFVHSCFFFLSSSIKGAQFCVHIFFSCFCHLKFQKLYNHCITFLFFSSTFVFVCILSFRIFVICNCKS